MGREEFITFMGCLFYTVWSFRNKILFTGNGYLGDATNELDFKVEEFTQDLRPSQRTKASCSYTESVWTPPLEGWIKINVDASWSDNSATLVFVVCDHNGKLLFLSFKNTDAPSSFLAEVQALRWAMEYAKDGSCEWVLWSSDAQNVVKAVQWSEEDARWSS